MNKKKRTPKILLVVGSILLLTIGFCFLLFETDVIYDIDITNFDTVGNELKRPISVEEVMRQIEPDYGNPSGNPVPGNGSNQQGVTLPGTTTTPVKPVIGDGDGKLVTSVQSIGIYDAPTQKGTGTFVNVRPSMDEHSTAYTGWWGLCYTNTSQPGNTIRNRVGGITVKDGVALNNSGYPLVAVGPRVMNPSRQYASLDQASAGEMKYGSVIDIVVEKGGTEYYIPAVVADCKAHTYPTWMAQSGYAVKGGNLYYTAPGQRDQFTNPSTYDLSKANAYDNSVVEITAASSSLKGLSDYAIKGIIVY